MTLDDLTDLIDGAGCPMPTEADLHSLEAALGLKSLDAYRRFLRAIPGGIVRGDIR